MKNKISKLLIIALLFLSTTSPIAVFATTSSKITVDNFFKNIKATGVHDYLSDSNDQLTQSTIETCDYLLKDIEWEVLDVSESDNTAIAKVKVASGNYKKECFRFIKGNFFSLLSLISPDSQYADEVFAENFKDFVATDSSRKRNINIFDISLQKEKNTWEIKDSDTVLSTILNLPTKKSSIEEEVSLNTIELTIIIYGRLYCI